MATLIHEQEPLIRFEECESPPGASQQPQSSDLHMSENMATETNSNQEHDHGISDQHDVYTEKDKGFQVAQLKTRIQLAISKWHLQANVIDILIADTKDIHTLKQHRTCLNNFFSEVSRLGDEYQQAAPSDNTTHNKLNLVEKEHRVISRCLSDTIVGHSVECDRARPPFREHENDPASGQRRQESIPRDNTVRFMDTFIQQSSLSRLPLPEPTVFSGNALAYNSWKTSFDLLIDKKPISTAEKLHYLQRYLGGSARECIEGFLVQPNPNSYNDARDRLDQRYGNSFFIANAFRQKLLSWPNIPPHDGEALQRLSDFLCQCSSAMVTNSDMRFLNDPMQCQPLLMKLPDDVLERWKFKVDDYRNTPRSFENPPFVHRISPSYPPFHVFASFISHQAQLACDPMFAFQANRGQPDRTRFSSHSTSFATSGTEETRAKLQPSDQSCLLCRGNHWLGLCAEFRKKRIIERHQFAKQKGLCFNCLEGRHLAKDCTSSHRCRVCDNNHSTFLHFIERKDTRNAEEGSTHVHESNNNPVTNNATAIRNVNKSSMTVPVYVTCNDGEKEVLTYALLDTQSDATFITNSLCDKLQVNGTRTRLPLLTMSREENIVCEEITGLNVRGLKQDIVIPVTSAFTRDSLPSVPKHIPSAETASQWPHLSEMIEELPPKQDCDIGLLIGYDCPRAITPRKVVSDCAKDAPFAVLTDLGWSIVGPMDVNQNNVMCMCHRVFHKRKKKHIRAV